MAKNKKSENATGQAKLKRREADYELAVCLDCGANWVAEKGVFEIFRECPACKIKRPGGENTRPKRSVIS